MEVVYNNIKTDTKVAVTPREMAIEHNPSGRNKTRIRHDRNTR